MRYMVGEIERKKTAEKERGKCSLLMFPFQEASFFEGEREREEIRKGNLP
jgi:hypothetical protein